MNDWKKILIGVDNTPTSNQGVEYVARIAGGLPGVRMCLLHVYPEPPPDYYSGGGTLDSYRRDKEKKAEQLMKECDGILQQAGVNGKSISHEIRMADQKTISETILTCQQEGGYGTLVVGRRGVSKAEEFLFGSISSALIHHAKQCTVWVVSQ
jgi:nucleotide-binding universal stress UspA family protein